MCDTNTNDMMFNFDGQIEPGSEERLRDGETGGYPARDFYGVLNWDPETDNFMCQVFVYGEHIATTSAPSLKSLMETTSEQFGRD